MDANQSEIVKALREAGAQVQSLAAVGKGVPDLLVGYRGANILIEVKDERQPPSKRRLTPDESNWHIMWGGQVATVKNADEALDLLLSATSSGC